MKLSETVKVGQNFRRSINIKEDQNNLGLLESFLCSETSEQIIASMLEHVEAEQCAFTWTGPYGAGKSSLALFLAALKSEDVVLKKAALAKLTKPHVESSVKSQRRSVISIVGEPTDPVELFSRSLGLRKVDPDNVLKKVQKLSKEGDGVIVFVDEMGKFLDGAASGKSIDVYFFQQLAELANRSAGRIIFVGILHQAFADYARMLPKTVRDEWTKIQGRFVDFAVNSAGEEQLELISRAIETDKKPKKVSGEAQIIAEEICRNKPANQTELENVLTNCWPLHPVVAALLGPASRKRFGQNQRSIFSFLSSSEPYGFQNFIKLTDVSENKLYSVVDFFEYIKSNFEAAILASPDAKLWTVASEGIAKASVNAGDDQAVNTLKAITVIELFKMTSGISATEDILACALSVKKIKPVLEELGGLNIVRHNRHTNNYALFEGSDFDIESELDFAYKQISEIDFKKINEIAALRPIVAKKHYHMTGAMRWMDIHLTPYNGSEELTFDLENGFGQFRIILPTNENAYNKALSVLDTYRHQKNSPVLLTVVSDYKNVVELSRELLALEWMRKNSSELAGDKIARKEVENRYSLVTNMLHNSVQKTLPKCEWYENGENIGVLKDRDLSSYCSDLADQIFNKSPKIKSEMLNRSKPSGSANAALNALLKCMVKNTGEERLGIEGYPAEGGLFKILLEETGLYSKQGKSWSFGEPTHSKELKKLWDHTDKVLKKADKNISLKEIYSEWREAPYGIKDGLHPFLMACYLLSKKGHVAIYLDETYVPDIDDLFVDYLIRTNADIRIRYVSNDIEKESILNLLAKGLEKEESFGIRLKGANSPLSIAREMVRLTEKLNPWVLRTRGLSKSSKKVRELLKNAHDPNKLIFDDIASMYELHKDPDKGMQSLTEDLKELVDAYPDLLNKLGQTILTELQVNALDKNAIHSLQARAKNIQQSSGDFRIDALAARLATFEEKAEDVAGIAGLAANKPINDWIDLDVDRALIEIAVLCEGFKKAELYARVKGREQKRHAIALTSGLTNSERVHQLSFDVLDDHKPEIEKLKLGLKSSINKSADKELVLAAIAELSAELMDELESEKQTVKKVPANG